jgi:hypothetical protein
MVACWLVVFAKALHAGGDHGVESDGLQINFKPINRGHVVAIDWATSPANCANSFLPCVVQPAMSTSIQTVRNIQSTPHFFAYLSF